MLCADLARDHEIIAIYRNTVPEVASQLRWPVVSGQASSAPADIYCVQADLACREDIRRVVEVAQARYGSIDYVINSAADTRFHGRLLELWESGDEALSQLSVNSVAPFKLISAIFQSCWKDQPDENARHNRAVVNVSSASGAQVGNDRTEAYYAASKAALNMLTLHLSLELAPYSVRANAISPSEFKDTPRAQRVVDAIRNLLAGNETGIVSKVP